MNRVAAIVLWFLLSHLVTPAYAQTGPSADVAPGTGKPIIENEFSSTSVDASLRQIELSPDLILSAGRGASFSIHYPENAGVVMVSLSAGPAVILDIKRNRLLELNPGQSSLSLAQGLPPDGSEPEPGVAARDALMRNPFKLSDSIMARQQQYLGSLKIDVRDLNRGLASIIRSLVPK